MPYTPLTKRRRLQSRFPSGYTFHYRRRACAYAAAAIMMLAGHGAAERDRFISYRPASAPSRSHAAYRHFAWGYFRRRFSAKASPSLLSQPESLLTSAADWLPSRRFSISPPRLR